MPQNKLTGSLVEEVVSCCACCACCICWLAAQQAPCGPDAARQLGCGTRAAAAASADGQGGAGGSCGGARKWAAATTPHRGALL